MADTTTAPASVSTPPDVRRGWLNEPIEDVGNITAPDVTQPSPAPPPVEEKPKHVAPVRPYVYPTEGGEPTLLKSEAEAAATAAATPTEPVDPNAIPDWGEVTKTPEYQNLSTDQRKAALDNYTQQMRIAGHQLAVQNNEDPARYDKHLNEFYTREKNALDPPFKAFDDTVTTAVEAGVTETAKIGVGAALLTKHILYPEHDLSDIKNMSIDEATHARDALIQAQPDQEHQAALALDFLKNPHRVLQDPKYDFPGGPTGALNAVTNYNMANSRLQALNSYISSNGAEIPNETETEKLAKRASEYPQKLADNMQKVSDLYIQDHPKAYGAAKTVGAMIPFIAGHTLAAAIGGPEAAVIADGLMNSGDSFQNAYESGHAVTEAREKAGERFNPDERENMILDYASRSAFSVGSINTIVNYAIGNAAEALHVSAANLNVKGIKDTIKNVLLNPKEAIKFLTQAGVEVAGQAGLQTGAQIASNIAAKESGVSPDQDIYEGIGQAAGQGAIFGGMGVGLRTIGSMFRWGVDNVRAQSIADSVKALAEQHFQNSAADGMTRGKALDIVLNEHVPAQFRDSIRSRIALDESAKDQTQVADTLDAAKSSATAAEMRKQADATKNATVVPTESQGDKLDAEQQADLDALNKRKAEREAKAKQGKGAGVTPTEEGAAPTEKEGAAPTEVKGAATPEDTVNALKAKIDQLMPDATQAEKEEAGWKYITTINNTREQLQRTAARQLLHETGLIPKAAPEKNWAKHTPELMDESAAHLSNYLDQQITAKKEAAVIPPGIFEEAARTNDPTNLIKMLKAGRTLHLSFDESEQYEKFLDDNFHRIGSVYDPATDTYEIIAREPKPTLPTTTLTFESETPEYEKGTEALPAHPREAEYLKAAQEQIAGNTPLLTQLEDYNDQGQSAALSRYRRSLREWADAMRKGGFESDLDHPPEYFRNKDNVSAINKKTGLKVPSPYSNLQFIAHEYGRFKAQLPKQISLEEPLGKAAEEGEDTAAKREIEREASERAAAIKGGTADPIYASITRGAQNFAKELSPEDQAALWRALNKFTQGQIPIPEGTPDADERAIREVFKRFTDWAAGHADDPGIKEATAPGAEAGAGPAAGGAPPGEPGLHAGPPEGGLPGEPGHPGTEGGTEVTKPGGGKPGVPPTGTAAIGKPEELPPAGGEPAAGTTPTVAKTGEGAPAAGAPGERGAGVERPGGATAASRERTGIIQEVPAKPTATGAPVISGGGKRTEPTAAPGGGPPGRVTYSAEAIAKAMIKKPEVAEDYEIDVNDFDKDPAKIAAHIEELEADQEDPDAWYREMYNDLGIKLPKEKPAAAVAPVAAKPAVKLSEPEQRAFDNAVTVLANAKAKELWADRTKMKAMGFDPMKYNTPGDLVVHLGDMFRGMTKRAESFKDKMDILQGMSTFKLPEAVTEGATTAAQTTAGAPPTAAAEPQEKILNAYKTLQAEQGGPGAVSIGKLIARTGLPKEDVHAFLLDQRRKGNADLHPTTLVPTSLSAEDKAGALDLGPGYEGEPAITATIRPQARAPEPAAAPAAPERAPADPLPRMYRAYQELSAERQRRSVPIADVAERAGVPVNEARDAIAGMIARGQGSKLQLDTGDWPSSTEAQKAAAVDFRGAKRTMMAFTEPLEEAAPVKETYPPGYGPPLAEGGPLTRTDYQTERTLAGTTEAAPAAKGFTTALGSTYEMHPDGTTTRTKAARAEHPGDEGLKDKSEKTVFLTPEQANALAPPQGKIRVIDHGDGTLSLATIDEQGKPGIAPSQKNIPYSTTPTVGTIPLELWKKGTTGGVDSYSETHFGNKITEVKAAAPAAPETAPANLIVPKGTGSARINNLTMQIARASLEHPETAEAHGLDIDEIFGGESYDPTRQIDVQHLADHIDTAMEERDPEQHLALLENWANNINKVIIEKSRPAPVETPAVRTLEDTQAIADKLATHMVNNPAIAADYGMSAVTDGASVIDRIKKVFPNATGEQINRNITMIAQKLGVIEPPRAPGDTHSGGVMYSLKPGVAGTNAPLYADGLVVRLRNSPDPELQDFAISLNAHIDNLTGIPIRQLNFLGTPALFYDQGELWVTPELLRHPDAEHAIAHELQHAIAQQKITNPQTQEEFLAAQRWEYLRNQIRAGLPADIRDSLDTRMAKVFAKYSGFNQIDTKGLTAKEINWLPVTYALHTSENMLHAAFSNPEFRGYLRGVYGLWGNSALDDVKLWGRTVFGHQALQFADRVAPLTMNRPGIPMRFDPRYFDIKEAYPLTDNEKTVQARIRKYGLGQGVDTMVQRVASLSNNPNHRTIANAILAALSKHPEIKLGLETRLGGVAGTYDFRGDRVSVNPRFDDSVIEGSIIHEVTHALTLGKIRAFEAGQIHLLSAADCQSIIDLEDLRVAAMDRRDVPQAVRDIASIPNHQERMRAWMEFGNQHPDEATKFYGLTDTAEFASEALSNGEFQKHLESIPYQEGTGKPKTMLQKLFSWVRKFLGFKEDTVLSNAFDNVSRLMGGQRVMEADFEHGGIKGQKTMTMDQNMMAKRYLDDRVQREGYRDAREVPIDKLNDWLHEFRENMYNMQDLSKPTTIAPPEIRGHIAGSDELSNMTDGLDIVDHLSKITGVLARDTDNMREVLTRALVDKAITPEQYIEGHKALDGLEDHFVNKLVFTAGKEEDYDSLKNKLGRWAKKLVLPHAGWGSKEMHAEYLKFTNDQVNEAAAQILRLRKRYLQAVKQDYKVSDPSKLPPAVIEEHNRIASGENPAPTTPVNTVNALKDERAYIRANSRYIVNNEMVSDDVATKIIKNYPSYFTRTYKIFDDTQFAHRSDSTRYRSAAEAELNANATPQAKGAAIEAHAKAAGDEAARVFPVGSTEAEDAYAKAYDAAKATAKANPAAVMIDKMLDEFEQIARNRQTKGLQYGHAYAIDSTLMEELSPLLNKSPALRNLMGEQHDLQAKFVKTALRQKTFINSIELGKSLNEMGRKNGYIGDRYTSKLSAQIPKQFAHLGVLADKWTTPDIAQTLTDYSETLRTLDQGPMANVLRTLEGLSRYTATIGSPMRGVANVWSGIFAHLNNGFLNPMDPTALKAAGDVIQAQAFRRDAPALNAYMDKMHRLGLSDKSGDQRLLMEFLRHGPQIMSRDPQDFLEQIFQWGKKAQYHVGPLGDFMVDLHTLGNTMSKASQFEKQKVRERAVNDWDVKNRGATPLTDDQIEAKAAQKVRDTNISYSLATPAIRKMRKGQVVGTFLTFWGESLRSYMHSWTYAVNDVRSTNPIRRQEGISRLAGLATSLTVLPAIGAASKAIFGVSNDEDKAFRALLPPWEKNNVLFYLPTDNEGVRHYINLSYLSPQGDVGRAINAAFAPNNDGPIGSASAAAYEIFRPVFNLGLMPSSIIDAYRNQTAYGTPIYDPEDHWWNKTSDIVQHVLGPLGGGGTGRLFTRTLPGLTTPGGRISPSGNVADLWTGLVPELTGLNIRAISIPDRFMSELYSSKDSIDQAQHLFTGPVQRSNNEMTDQQIQDAYQRAEDARRNVFRQLSQKVDAARFGGMDTNQIKAALKTRHYSPEIIDDLLTGRYHAYKPSKMVLKNARANGNFIPESLFSRGAVSEDEE